MKNLKNNEILRALDKAAVKATWKSCMSCIVGDEELMAKFEAERDAINDEWLKTYKALKGE